MFTNDVITQIQSDKFWYKQIVQALVHTDNYEIFSLVYQRKIEIKLNLSNAGIKILHTIAPILYYNQFISLIKNYISNKELQKLKTIMLYYDVDIYGIPDIIWSKLLQSPDFEVFNFMMYKVNYEYPKYLFNNSTDIFVSQWVDIVPEKYCDEINKFVNQSIRENKINYLKIVVPKCKELLDPNIQIKELLLDQVESNTLTYVLTNHFFDKLNLEDITFSLLIKKMKSLSILKKSLSNKKILEYVQKIRGVRYSKMKYLPLEILSSVSSVAAIPIQQKNIDVFNMFLSKGVYSQNKSFWLEFTLATDAFLFFDLILASCSYSDIIKSNFRIVYIAASKLIYLLRILEKFNKLDNYNFNPDYYSSLFYRELYTNTYIPELYEKLLLAIPSTYNPLFISNVLLKNEVPKNKFDIIVSENREMFEYNLDIILDELININRNIENLFQSFPDSNLYGDGYIHLRNYICSNPKPGLLFIDLCEFFSEQTDIRANDDYLFTQLFNRCKNRLVFDYFVNKYPSIYSYFVNKKSEVVGIKIGFKIIGETNGIVGLKTVSVNVKEQCLICCEHESNIQTRCLHQYCLKCLTKWYSQGKDSCPLCREKYYPISRIA